MKTAVYIATTAGPVRIERIVGETVPQSNVFVGRGYKPLEPISADYDDFVGPGGPVERAFGPFDTRSFRLDVSRAIDTGNSWELAVFTAHDLVRTGQLAGPDDLAERVVLLSGRVDADFNVCAVGHIDDKLNSSAALLGDSNCPVVFFFPAADAVNQISEEGAEARSVESAMEVVAYLNEALGGEIAPLSKPASGGNEKTNRGGLALLSILLIIFIGGMVGFDWSGDKDSETVAEPSPPNVAAEPLQSPSSPLISIFERRPPSGKSCIDVHFGSATPREVQVNTADAEKFSSSQLNDICGLRVQIGGAAPSGKGEAVLRVLSGRYIQQEATEQRTFFDGQAEWVLDLPGRMEVDLQFSVSVKPHDSQNESVTLKHQVLH
jgi:hypothetical protein